jgi:cathepsin L
MNWKLITLYAAAAISLAFVPRNDGSDTIVSPAPEAKMAAPCCPVNNFAADKNKKKHGRGHKEPVRDVRAVRHRVSQALHGARLKKLPIANMPTYDASKLGLTPPVDDQGDCGNCYEHSGTHVCASAQYVAGVWAKTSGQALSVQCMLDCHPEFGGCNGGDEYQVSQWIMANGCPSLAQYPGAGSSPGQCKGLGGMTLYMVNSLVMCSNTQGVANTQDIKNCVLAYGYVSVAGAAGDDWDNYQPGTILQGNATDVNHAIGIVGWNDNGSPPYWIVQNSWGTEWGNNGYLWIAYGADSIGTEAYAAIATPVPVPPAPPVPPVPPAPPGPPAPSSVATILTTNTGSIYDGVAMELTYPGTKSLIVQLANTSKCFPGRLETDLAGPVPTPPAMMPTGLADIDILKSRVAGLEANLREQNALLLEIRGLVGVPKK